MADLAALDVTVPKFPPSAARGAHADALAFGLRYLSSHISADTSHLGFRYMAVANMVLLGYPRGSDSRPTAVQVRDRAARVRGGDLRRMLGMGRVSEPKRLGIISELLYHTRYL